jgi:dihydrofolate reductase
MLSIIVAASTNMVIGKNNDLPWNLPTDLKYFKSKTLGKKVVMGRKCWESIPEKFRPLPNRENIILTGQFDYNANGAWTCHDAEMFMSSAILNPTECFIIGGAEIYKMAFNYADTLYLTRINAEVDGDVYLEGFNENEWVLESESETYTENGFSFNFLVYHKKNRK